MRRRKSHSQSKSKHLHRLHLPPVQAPTEIEIVEDEEEVEETIIESTEMDRDEIIEVEDVVIEEEEEIIDVPFAVIEDVPVFPGCEDVEKNQLRNCFQEQMNKHIKRNFRYPEIAPRNGDTRACICEFYHLRRRKYHQY
jgi:protein TonB